MRYFSLFMMFSSIGCIYLIFDMISTAGELFFLQELMLGLMVVVFIFSFLLFTLVILNEEINK